MEGYREQSWKVLVSRGKRTLYIAKSRTLFHPERNGSLTNFRWKRSITMSVSLLIMTQLFLCPVSSKTVSIVSGFEKRILGIGQNFTLKCQATGLYHVTITWLLDGLPLEYQKTPLTGSVQFSADNPHQSEKEHIPVSDKDNSRFSIKNSNEYIDHGDKNDDIKTEQNLHNADGDHNSSTKASSVVVIRKPPTADSQPADMNLVPIIPSNSMSSGTGGVSISSELTLADASVEDGGVYTCVARDVIRESVTWSRKITILGPLSVRQNRPIFALIDSLVIIPCTVLGSDDSFNVRWFYKPFTDPKDKSLMDGPLWTPLPNDPRQTVHLNGSLEVREARKTSEGIYRCEVDLVEKIVNMSTALRVMVPPKIEPFTFPPVKVGDPVGEFCFVTEGDLPLDIAWYKNGRMLTSSRDVEMHSSGKRALSFAINSVNLASAGNYSCCAENNVSRACVVSELIVLERPKISDFPSRLAVISGFNVTIPCAVTGFPKPNVTWMRVLDDSSNKYVTIPNLVTSHGNTSSPLGQLPNGTLLIRNVSSAVSGKYLCRAVNKVDEISRVLTLQVHNPARIVSLTGTSDVIYGSDVTVECESWGDDVVEVEWRKGGEALALPARYDFAMDVLENSLINSRHPVSLYRLRIRNSSRSDTGVYSCKVANKYGTNSRDIKILVRSPPALPDKLEVIDKGTSFIRLLVSPGVDDGGSKHLAYILSYKMVLAGDTANPLDRKGSFLDSSQKTDIIVVRFPTSASGGNHEQELALDGLECGSEYEMSIRSENGIGASFDALSMKAKTIGSVPQMPAVNELVVDVNQSAVVLDLRAWQNGGCPMTKLTIEYARHGDTEWNVTGVADDVLENVLSSASGEISGKNPGHVIIRNLQTGTWYKIWTSACNNAGCNYVTHSVATLRKDGSIVPPLIDIEKKASEHGQEVRYLVPMVCGFGLVFVLVILLLLYRCKHRSRKDMRMREARKMANSLLYKTDDKMPYTVPRLSLKVDSSSIEEASEGSCHPEPDLNGTVSSDGNADEYSPEVNATCADSNTATEPFLEEVISQKDEARRDHDLSESYVPPLPTSVSQYACESEQVKEGSNNETKQALMDKAELAVFRNEDSSDDEEGVISPLVCDESAFSDAGTWSYFHPTTKLFGRKYSPVPTRERKPERPARHSSSSGTDDEVAEVFGLTSSKKKSVPTREGGVRNSDQSRGKQGEASISEFSTSNGRGHPQSAVKSRKRMEKRPSPRNGHANHIAADHYYTYAGGGDRVGYQVTAGSSYACVPPPYRPLPGSIGHDQQTHFIPAPQRLPYSNANPFRPVYLPPPPAPWELHVPKAPANNRGHTYSHASYPQMQNSAVIQSMFSPKGSGFTGNGPPSGEGSPDGYQMDNNPSPFAERQWVDTYDSQYGTARSKRPSWGSTDLDKETFYTPPSSDVSQPHRNDKRQDTKSTSGDSRNGDVNDNHIPLCPKSDRKLESGSPRDSGIGSDDTPASGQVTQCRDNAMHSRIRRIRDSKSVSPLENRPDSRDELSSRSNASSRNSRNSNISRKGDYVLPISPPPSPPVQDTKLAPHIFVNISGKCNTSPIRSPRASRPNAFPNPPTFDSASVGRRVPSTKSGHSFPTPPASGQNSPADSCRTVPYEQDDKWDGTGTRFLYRNNSDSKLIERDCGSDRLGEIECDKVSRFTDTAYRVLEDGGSWQASTLV